MTPPQRLARREDIPALQALMRESVLEIFPAFYDQRQTESAAIHIAHLDELLVDDGTYFVHEADGEIVACGGWSRRNRLYAGEGEASDDDRLLDPVTEPARVRAMFVRSDWTRQASAGRSWTRPKPPPQPRGSLAWSWARRCLACRSTPPTGSLRRVASRS